MKSAFQLIGTVLALLVPGIVFAASEKTLFDIFTTLGLLVGAATPIVVALAILAFFWGLAMYMFNIGGTSTVGMGGHMGASGSDPQKAGRSLMVYGVFVLFIMLSVVGLINILKDTFGIDHAGGTLTPPTIPGALNAGKK